MDRLEHPSPVTPLGAKGVGEGGAIPGPAAVANAVDDALAHLGVVVRSLPITPGAGLALAQVSEPAPSAPALPVRWRLLTILTVSYGAGAFGMLGISPLSPSLVEGLGLTRFQVAFLIPSIYLSGLLFSLPGGRLADRLGVRPSFLGGLAVAAIGLLAAALAPGFLAFLVCLFVAGSGWSVVNPALGKAIMDVFPVSERGIAMGVKQMGLTLGGLVAALALPAIAATLGWRYAVGACSVIVAVPVALGWRPLAAFNAGARGAAATARLGRHGIELVVGAAARAGHLLRHRLRARHGPGRGAELPAALHDPGARLRQDRRRPPRGLVAGGRRGLPPRPGRGQRSLGRRPALALAGVHGRRRRGHLLRLRGLARHLGRPGGDARLRHRRRRLRLGRHLLRDQRGGRRPGPGRAAERRGLRRHRARASSIGPPIFGLLLEGFDSYAVAWAVFAVLSGLVAIISLLAGPAIDRESGVRSCIPTSRRVEMSECKT